MQAVFDSNIVIDWMNGHKPAAEVLSRYKTRYISRLSWAEALVGFKQGLAMQKAVDALNHAFVVIDPDAQIAWEAVNIRQNTRARLTDAIIYATARQLKLTLLTRDVKDFDENAPDIYVPYQLKEQ